MVRTCSTAQLINYFISKTGFEFSGIIKLNFDLFFFFCSERKSNSFSWTHWNTSKMKLSETGTAWDEATCWWKCCDPCGYSESCISISKIIWIELSILYAFLSWTFENKEGKNRCVNVLRVKSALRNRGKVQNAPKSAEDSVLNAISIISQWLAMIYVDKPKKFF